MTMNRRWFLQASATALIALTAARIVPVSSLPLVGDVYDTLHHRLLTWLRREFNAYVAIHRKAPERIRVGSAVYQNYEAALDANMRFGVKDEAGFVAVMFKGRPMVEDLTIGPWMIEMVGS